MSRIPIPHLAGAYRRIYVPAPAVYHGPDTALFRAGVCYQDWITNDFTAIRRGEELHVFGITHPRPDDFTDAYQPGIHVHEAESQLYHAVFRGSLTSLASGGMLEQKEQVLSPFDRPGEPEPCWAPCSIEKDGLYYLFYTPGALRAATSADLYHWAPQGTLFTGAAAMRDPYVFFWQGQYHVVYVESDLLVRSSPDLISWGAPLMLQRNPFGPRASQESPCIFCRNGIWYLLWCIFDGHNGAYDERSFLFASDNPLDFNDRAPVAMLPGHAPEIWQEDGKSYLVSTFFPCNGLSIAPLEWA